MRPWVGWTIGIGAGLIALQMHAKYKQMLAAGALPPGPEAPEGAPTPENTLPLGEALPPEAVPIPGLRAPELPSGLSRDSFSGARRVGSGSWDWGRESTWGGWGSSTARYSGNTVQAYRSRGFWFDRSGNAYRNPTAYEIKARRLIRAAEYCATHDMTAAQRALYCAPPNVSGLRVL